MDYWYLILRTPKYAGMPTERQEEVGEKDIAFYEVSKKVDFQKDAE